MPDQPRLTETPEERFGLLLPFYVTGQLPEADRSFVDAYIKSHPDAIRSVDFTRHLSRAVKNIGCQRDPEVGLQYLLAHLQPQPQSGFLKRVWLKMLAARILLGVAFAVAALLGQGVFMAVQDRSEETPQASAPAEAHVVVTLHRGAEMVAVTAAVTKLGGKIVSTQIGAEGYKVFIKVWDQSRIRLFIQELMSSGLVEEALVL